MISILLYSGGLDSYILNKLYKPDVLLYIDMGFEYQKVEKYLFNKLPLEKYSQVKIIHSLSLPLVNENGHVPLRNVFFLQLASFYGEIIYLGALKGETSRDKSKQFAKNMQKMLNYQLNDLLSGKLRKKIEIKFPFLKYTKTQILKKYIDLGYDINDLKQYTVSCYNGIRCGNCMSCFRRYIAEINNDIVMNYRQDPILFMNKELSKMSKLDKFKYFFKKEFWINLPSNIDVIKAKRRLNI